MNTLLNNLSISADAATRQLPDFPDPLACFSRLTENGNKAHTVLLESAEPSCQKVQRSLLFTSCALSVVCRADQVVIRALDHEGHALLPCLLPMFASFSPKMERDAMYLSLPIPKNTHGLSEHERLHHPSALTVLRDMASLMQKMFPGMPEAIFLTGVFAYDLVDHFEALPEAKLGNDFPDYQFYLASQIIIFDHVRQSACAYACSFTGCAQQALQQTISRLAALIPSEEIPLPITMANTMSIDDVSTDCDDETFAHQVDDLKKSIVAGDIFQVVLSRSFAMPCQDAFAAYRVLRTLNPSPYLFYLHADHFVLLGASPESALKVDGATRQVEISPIAGTARRGLRADGSIDMDLDGKIEAELRLDEKENAEHMMLVDLARNDIARIASPGSRHVVELLRTERYSHVMHLVSRVRGIMRDDVDALHAYQASMNMGTLTGAPKVRAMQLIRSHEKKRRGHYGGAIGYLRGNGDFDTAIVIRAALVQNKTAHIRAGAGIVFDSVPQKEAEETRRKAEAMMRAIAFAERLEVSYA